jgi:putative endonuclease
MSSTELGRQGETIAVQALESHGYVVVDRNWRCPVGEVDIVAREGDTWVFVEVKLRQGHDYGSPEEAITQAKRDRLMQLAQNYLADHDLSDVSWRIDVVAIGLAPSGKVLRLTLHQDAVRADD